MLRIDRLTRLVVEIGQQGVLSGTGKGPLASAELGDVEEALPAVREYVDNPTLPDDMGNPGLTRKITALAVVAGARRTAADAAAIERAAAEVAREEGATVRELATIVGISERAANDRYRRLPTASGAQAGPSLTWTPKKRGTPDELAGELGEQLTFAGLDGVPQTATYVKYFFDSSRGDVYVVRHDDGREEEISIADILRASPRGPDSAAQEVDVKTQKQLLAELAAEGHAAGEAAGRTVVNPMTAARNPEAYGHNDPTRIHNPVWTEAFVEGWHDGVNSRRTTAETEHTL